MPPRRQKLALRLGLRMLHGLPEETARRIVAVRNGGQTHYNSLEDLARRAQLGRAVLLRLVQADAVRSLALDRRRGLWQALAEEPQRRELPLFDQMAEPVEEEPAAPLPALTEYEEVLADYRAAGLSLRAHPISFLRAKLDSLRILRSADLATAPVGRQVRVAGLVLVRQRPGTASGITFVTLEDETGVANLIIKPDIWRRYRPAAKNAAALMAQGRLERQGEVIHVLVNKLVDLVELSRRVDSQSRDFR